MTIHLWLFFLNDVSSGSLIPYQGLALCCASHVQKWYIVLGHRFANVIYIYMDLCAWVPCFVSSDLCLLYFWVILYSFVIQVSLLHLRTWHSMWQCIMAYISEFCWSYGCQELLWRLFPRILRDALVTMLLISAYQWAPKHYCKYEYSTADVIGTGTSSAWLTFYVVMLGFR